MIRKIIKIAVALGVVLFLVIFVVGITVGSFESTVLDTTENNIFTAGTQFNPNINYDILTDKRDGQKYLTVKIGDLTWMAENLNYVTDSSWCYGNDDSNCTKYGRLYTWDAAMTVCPDGWRLSDIWDWKSLAEFVARGRSVAGYKLKSQVGWAAALSFSNEKSYKGTGVDMFGFSALPGGRGSGGNFRNVGEIGYWWSAPDYVSSNAQYRFIRNRGSSVDSSWNAKTGQFSVRCIQK